MTKEQLLFNLLGLIVTFIPIGGLLWKFSRIIFQVELNKKNIDNLGDKLNNNVDGINERFLETETKLNNIELIMARFETKLNLLLSKNGVQV
jgi:hypothetical protein